MIQDYELAQIAEEAEERGFSKGYSKAENDYHTQSENDRQGSYDCGYEVGYNKAIDDFVVEIEKEYDNDDCPNVSDYLDYEISIRDLFKIAEQLNAGVENE